MRRRRFTVTASHPASGRTRESQILAYTPEQARRHYEVCGYTVVSVETTPRAARSKPAPGAPWSFDRKRIATAFEAMTRQPLPANLKLVSDCRGVRVNGWFSAYPSEGPKLKVHGDLSPEQANRTLWHELAHCAQYVRLGSTREWVQAWDRQRKARYGYRNRPWEIEAREWEVLAETDWLLDGDRR